MSEGPAKRSWFVRHFLGDHQTAICIPLLALVTLVVMAEQISSSDLFRDEALLQTVAIAYIVSVLLAFWFERKRRDD